MRDRCELQSLYLHTDQKNNDMVHNIQYRTDLIIELNVKVGI